MENIFFRVESYGGALVENICMDMCKTARRLDIMVLCRVNGLDIKACPEETPREVYERWLKNFNTQHGPAALSHQPEA